MASFKAFLNSPVGPKTTHFWGPVANWGFVIAVRSFTWIKTIEYNCISCSIVSIGFTMQGLVDMQKPPEMISGNMTGGLELDFTDWFLS